VFPCTECGLCYQNIAGIPEILHFDMGNGVCKHYDSSVAKCKIYEEHPVVCRIDLEYSKFLSRQEFYKMNAYACNVLQEQKTLI
jgi:Fe-S-cluster containining protein